MNLNGDDSHTSHESPDSLPALQRFVDIMFLPPQQEKKRTFLDISGFPYYENVISNWYAYFLQQDEAHGLGHLFLNSLLSISARKGDQPPLISNYLVETEYTTSNKKRIDILIKGVGPDSGKYIIIENKIYHWLNNDLSEYWDTCKAPANNKLGIVLTLASQAIPAEVRGRYVNILHSELTTEIRISLGDSITKTPYLADFLIAIDNLYNDLYMNDEVLFYYKNISQCNRIYDITLNTYKYICEQINIAGQRLQLEFGGGRAEDYRYLYLREQKGVYYTIIFHRMFEIPSQINIVIELHGKGLALVDHIQSACSRETIEARGLDFKPFAGNSYYMHYAGRTYDVSLDALSSFSDFIVQCIQSDFTDTMQDIVKVINIAPNQFPMQ